MAARSMKLLLDDIGLELGFPKCGAWPPGVSEIKKLMAVCVFFIIHIYLNNKDV